MRHNSRLFIGALLGTVSLLGATVTPASASGHTSVAAGVVDSSTRVRVEGTIVVFAGDGVETAVAAAPLADEVRLVTSAGDSIVLTGPLTDNVTTGSTFAGVVAVPTEAVEEVSKVVEEALGEAAPTVAVDTVEAESVMGSEILAASETLDAPLAVVAATITPEAVQAGQTAMAHTLDVAVVTLPTAPAELVMTDAAVDAMTTTLSTFWESQSAGQVASISRPAAVQRFESENACDPMAIWDEAAAKFETDSVWYWGYSAADHLVVIVPESCDGFGAGLGTVGSLESGGLIWAESFAPIMALTLAHEFGHNVGLEHSNVSVCTDNTVEGSACADMLYDDYYDVMGGGLYYYDVLGVPRSNTQLMALNVTQKSVLGALTAAAMPSVELGEGISASQAAFALSPASATTGIRGLEVTDPRTGEVYFVEYRSGTGMDSGSLYASGLLSPEYGLGVGVRVLKLRADGSSVVLTRPNALDQNQRPLFMTAAQSFTSASGGLKVAVTGIGATASVRLDLVATLLKLTTTPVPTVSGTRKVGYTLTANPGTWGPATVTLGYRWYRSGALITGATAKTYKLAAADLGKTIKVLVVGSKTGYTTASKVSADTTAVVSGTLSSPTPTVTGTKKVGYTLTANPGTWGPATVTLKYQWYRSGVAISYATAKTYKLVSADRYDTIKVRLTGFKAGYTTVSKYSASTVKVV